MLGAESAECGGETARLCFAAAHLDDRTTTHVAVRFCAHLLLLRFDDDAKPLPSRVVVVLSDFYAAVFVDCHQERRESGGDVVACGLGHLHDYHQVVRPKGMNKHYINIPVMHPSHKTSPPRDTTTPKRTKLTKMMQRSLLIRQERRTL